MLLFLVQSPAAGSALLMSHCKLVHAGKVPAAKLTALSRHLSLRACWEGRKIMTGTLPSKDTERCVLLRPGQAGSLCHGNRLCTRASAYISLPFCVLVPDLCVPALSFSECQALCNSRFTQTLPTLMCVMLQAVNLELLGGLEIKKGLLCSAVRPGWV